MRLSSARAKGSMPPSAGWGSPSWPTSAPATSRPASGGGWRSPGCSWRERPDLAARRAECLARQGLDGNAREPHRRASRLRRHRHRGDAYPAGARRGQGLEARAGAGMSAFLALVGRDIRVALRDGGAIGIALGFYLDRRCHRADRSRARSQPALANRARTALGGAAACRLCCPSTGSSTTITRTGRSR